VDCWLALRFKDQTIYFDTIRECYEAYVIYNFYAYCTVYLDAFCVPGLEAIVARKPQQKHVFPVSLLCGASTSPMSNPDPTGGSPFLRLCRHGVINYVVTRPLTTLCAFIAQALGVYGDGEFTNPLVAYPYLALINNVSQAWAMYCLILFYRATREELAPVRPFYKFVTVKAVVFLSFWQGQALLLIAKLDSIDALRGRTRGGGAGGDYESASRRSDYDDASFATALQEFAICVEMFFAAIAHAYAFPVSEYDGGRNVGNRERTLRDNVRDMFDLRDVYHDVVNFSESNKDEFWAEVSFRYRAFVGIFTGKTPLKGEYTRVRDESVPGDGESLSESGHARGQTRAARMSQFGHGSGTISELRGGGRTGALSDREPRAAGGPHRGSSRRGDPRDRSENDAGSEVALFASVSPKSQRGYGGGGRYRDGSETDAASVFSMPGVSALPGVDTFGPGGGFAVAPLEREGRVGASKTFTLE
jgi:hypothetical protein